MVGYWIRGFMSIIVLFCFSSSIFWNKAEASQAPVSRSKEISNNHYPGIDSNFPSVFEVISSSATSLVLEIKVHSYWFETNFVEGIQCEVLHADGYFQSGKPGEPGLLSAGVLLGVPTVNAQSFSFQIVEAYDVPGQHHLCPISSPELIQDPNGLPQNQGYRIIENPDRYSQDDFLPVKPIDLAPIGMIRSQRVARLSSMAFQYNPVRERLKLINRVRVEVHFGQTNIDQERSTLEAEGPFESVLRQTLINYEQALPWRFHRNLATSNEEDAQKKILMSQTAFKIQVNQDGVYQLTYSDLQLAGVPVESIAPQTIRMFDQSVETPIFINGEGDGQFNSEDYILFYGQKNITKYTDVNTYWLIWGGDNGLRMRIVDGTVHGAISPTSFMTTAHLETDLRYVNDSPSGEDNDHWYWYFLNANSGLTSQDFPFELQNLDPNAPSVTIRGLLKGYFANPQHHTRIYLNGNLIDDQIWSSKDVYTFTSNVPAALLNEGSNIITVECPLDEGISIDQVLINWFEIDYYHTYMAENDQLFIGVDQPGIWEFQVEGFSTDGIDVFDITDPFSPTLVMSGTVVADGPLYQISFEQQVNEDNRYLTLTTSNWLSPQSIIEDQPSNLKDPSNEADYIIISHAYFLDAIQPLVSYHEDHGLQVEVIDVQEIYDEFNGGIFDPQAINNFLTYAYNNWTHPAPSYVLLVGDGHYDFKNNYGDSGTNYIPPFLGEYDPWIGETASDNRYVTIDHEDILPDLFIGRLPVNNVQETEAIVEKILYYEENPIQGSWNRQLTFVADNPDAGGNFPGLSENLINNYLPDGFSAEKIYYGIAPYQGISQTRMAILNAINEGRLIINYIGHGAVQMWASENLFHVNSIGSLTNVGMYPFFFPMTCLEGYFIYPVAVGHNYPSLAESLVRAVDKGAIASFSPAGFGLATGHDILAQGLYTAFFFDGITQFGPATTLAKYYLYENGISYLDLIDTYNLLGDPATRLNIHPINVIYKISLPIVRR